MTDSPPSLLRDLAVRVRRARRERGWSRAELARRSGLSERYLARVEGGDGNISVLRLEALATALGTTPDALLRPATDPGRITTLVGLRGAGKSTVGPLLARRLDVPFVEVDDLIVDAAGGLPLDQLFELHGERYYRRLERETLRGLLVDRRRAVLAASGGVVHDGASWEMLLEQTAVVWLRARPEDHWTRVVAQGDRRPMADNPDAMDELRAMLSAREAVYARAALTIDTWRVTPEQAADRIAGFVRGLAPDAEQRSAGGGTIEA